MSNPAVIEARRNYLFWLDATIFWMGARDEARKGSMYSGPDVEADAIRAAKNLSKSHDEFIAATSDAQYEQ